MIDCDYCSKTTQDQCSRTGKCWRDHPESTGWAHPDDLKRDAKNFDTVIGWIEGEGETDL